MNFNKVLATKCGGYNTAKTLAPQGVMLHSTGANNPSLRRYAQPNDGKLGDNPNKNDFNQPGNEVMPHAWIGKLADGSVATYQTLEFTKRGVHCGCAKPGGASANTTHIAFEICEDGLNDAIYFGKVYQESVEFTAYLCKEFKLDPLKDGVIICHSEGFKRGIAGNHADVAHWFPKFGKSMDTFRADVKKQLGLINKPAVFNTASVKTMYAVDVLPQKFCDAEKLAAFTQLVNTASVKLAGVTISADVTVDVSKQWFDTAEKAKTFAARFKEVGAEYKLTKKEVEI